MAMSHRDTELSYRKRKISARDDLGPLERGARLLQGPKKRFVAVANAKAAASEKKAPRYVVDKKSGRQRTGKE